MNLPVTNKRAAILKAVYINLNMVGIMVIMTINVNHFDFGHWFVLASLIWGIIHIIKNNVHEAVLESETISLLVNKRTIKIPISEINSIDAASSLQSILVGTFRRTYFIETKKRYSFGSTILLGFISEKVFPEEPIEIRTIKSIIAHKNK
jgi:hypothetical protein